MFTKARELFCEELGFDSVAEMNLHFRDLKAKSGSDMEGTLSEISHALGHSSLRQTKTYMRKVQVVEALNNTAPLDE